MKNVFCFFITLVSVQSIFLKPVYGQDANSCPLYSPDYFKPLKFQLNNDGGFVKVDSKEGKIIQGEDGIKKLVINKSDVVNSFETIGYVDKVETGSGGTINAENSYTVFFDKGKKQVTKSVLAPDIKVQKILQKQSKDEGKDIPVYSSIDTVYSYEGDDCQIDQIRKYADMGNGKMKAIITYDRSFCDRFLFDHRTSAELGKKSYPTSEKVSADLERLFEQRKRELEEQGFELKMDEYAFNPSDKSNGYSKESVIRICSANTQSKRISSPSISPYKRRIELMATPKKQKGTQ